MDDRPVSDAVNRLRDVPQVAEHEVGAVTDEVRDQGAQVSGIVREAGQVPGLSAVADEIDALSARMQSALRDLPDAVAGAVQDEIGELHALLSPDTTGTRTDDMQAPDLSLPVFDQPSHADNYGPGDSDGVADDDASPQVVEFASEAEFNAAAESPQPNTTYRYRDVEWRTDDLARTISVTGTPRLKPATRRPGLQASIGHAGRDTDVGFHLLAHAFGGPTNPLNVVAGNGQRLEDGLTNLNQGAYKKFENEVRAHLKAGHDVQVEIHVVYKPGNTTRRPDKFAINVTVDGAMQAEYKFKNK